MNVTFKVGETPRVYVERIDITGNTTTRDKVIRREFRVNEGDAFNAIKVKRSQDRIQSLGFFQDKLEIKQTEGSAPDRVVLGVNVEEKPTGQLSLSGGYSSLERFVIQLAVSQNNFMGKGQQLDASASIGRATRSRSSSASPTLISSTSRSCSAARSIRRDYSSFNYIGNRPQHDLFAGQHRRRPRDRLSAHRISEFRRPLQPDQDKIYARQEHVLHRPTARASLVRSAQGRAAICATKSAARLTSLDRLFDASMTIPTAFIRPAASGSSFSQDFAGLGGDVRYVRTRADATKYKASAAAGSFSAHAEGGYIKPLQSNRPAPDRDAIRLTDRFFGPQLRGFDIRGIGPRIQRVPLRCATAPCWTRPGADHRRARRPRLLHGPSGARIPDQLRACKQPRAAAVGLRRRRLAVGSSSSRN